MVACFTNCWRISRDLPRLRYAIPLKLWVSTGWSRSNSIARGVSGCVSFRRFRMPTRSERLEKQLLARIESGRVTEADLIHRYTDYSPAEIREALGNLEQS